MGLPRGVANNGDEKEHGKGDERASLGAAGFGLGEGRQEGGEVTMRAFDGGTGELSGIFDMAAAAFAGALGVVSLLRHGLDFSILTDNGLDKFG